MSTIEIHSPHKAVEVSKRVSPTHNPRLNGIHDMLVPWGARFIGESDVIIVVTEAGTNLGAPARFMPAIGEIHVPEEAFGPKFRMDSIHSIIDFIRKHPAIAGRFIHEMCHARCSPDIRVISRIGKTLEDKRAPQAAILLLEGHAEANGYDELTSIEKMALRATVMEIVLEGVRPDDGSKLEMNRKSAATLLGLMSARLNKGIIDPDAVHDLNASVMSTLGVDRYNRMFQIAVSVSELPPGRYAYGVDRSLAELVRAWLECLDELGEEERKDKERTDEGDSQSENDEDATPPDGGAGFEDESDDSGQPGESDDQEGGDDGDDSDGDGDGDSGDGDQEGEQEGGGSDSTDDDGDSDVNSGEAGDADDQEGDGDSDDSDDSTNADGGDPGFGTYSRATDEELRKESRDLEDILSGLSESIRKEELGDIQQVAQVEEKASVRVRREMHRLRKTNNKRYSERWKK